MRRLAILLLALSGCVAGPARTLPPSATPTPTAPTAVAARTASPSQVTPPARLATPTAAATVSARPSSSTAPINIGLALTTQTPLRLTLRTDGDSVPFASLDGGHDPAVSPDGWRLAYWHRDNGAQDTNDALRTIDLRTGDDIEILRLQDEKAGFIAWRDDGTALAFTATSLDSVNADTPDERPRCTAVRTVDIGSHQAREVRRFDATHFFPVAWNATARVVIGWNFAMLRGWTVRVREDGSSGGETSGSPGDVTRDAKQILVGFSSDLPTPRAGIRVVRVDAPTLIAERQASPGTYLMGARFRPGTGDVVVLIMAADLTSTALEIWPAGSTSTRRVWTRNASAGPMIMRVDGKAAYVWINLSWQTIDLETGAMAPVDPDLGVASWLSFFVTDSASARLRR